MTENNDLEMRIALRKARPLKGLTDVSETKHKSSGGTVDVPGLSERAAKPRGSTDSGESVPAGEIKPIEAYGAPPAPKKG